MSLKTKAAFAVPVVMLSLGMVTSSSFAQAPSDEGVAQPTATRDIDDDDDDDFDMGWIGLAGLAGLAGLMRRDRHDRHDHEDHTLKR